MTSNDEARTKYIERRLLEARSKEQLDAICTQLLEVEHIPRGSVSAVKSELMKKGAFEFENPQDLEAKKPQSTKVIPVEHLVKALTLPLLADGHREVFDAGVQYGINSILVGVKLAQELCAMGVQQARPLLMMAQEMRAHETEAAKVIGAQLAAATMESHQGLQQQLSQLGQQITASAPNPLMSMMTQLMQPYFGQAFNRLMGLFGMSQQPPQQGQTEAQQPPEQAGGHQTSQQIPPAPPIKERPIEEWEG